jgi:hypothetical protein
MDKDKDKVKEILLDCGKYIRQCAMLRQEPDAAEIDGYIRAICDLDTEECPECEGTGHKFISDEHGREESDEPCTTCKGTGRVPKQPVVKVPTNPFVGYVDVVENIRMAKEQGFSRAVYLLRKDNPGVKFEEI